MGNCMAACPLVSPGLLVTALAVATLAVALQEDPFFGCHRVSRSNVGGSKIKVMKGAGVKIRSHGVWGDF